MQLVLILADDVLWRAAVARSLNKLPSIEAVEASSVGEARSLLEGISVDLLLTELQFSDGTALELIPHLRRDGRRIPMVVISALVAEFAPMLPPGVETRSKPIPMIDLRLLVTRSLGRADVQLPPFTLADYVQLAHFGKYSVQIELARDGEYVGMLTMQEGQAWSACDHQGEGIEAFLRLVALTDAAAMCSPFPTPPPERTLMGSGEHLLMEAARLADNTRARRAPSAPAAELVVPPSSPVRSVKVPAAPAMPRPTPPVPAARPVAYRAPSWAPRKTEPPPRTVEDSLFDQLYDEGIEALLTKRYRDAFDVLTRAKELRSTPTLEANLVRLRALGFA